MGYNVCVSRYITNLTIRQSTKSGADARHQMLHSGKILMMDVVNLVGNGSEISFKDHMSPAIGNCKL